MATYTDDDQDRKKGEDRKDAQSSTQLDDERMCRFHDYVDGSAAAVRPSHHHEVVQTSTQSFQAGYVHQIVAADIIVAGGDGRFELVTDQTPVAAVTVPDEP